MIRGRTARAQRMTTQASPRISFERGAVPLALEKWVQSGLNHARPTGREPHASRGSTSRMFSQKCLVPGWLAACIAMASGLWLIAMSTGRPAAA